VRTGKVRFYPGRYTKTYLDWLGEKRDWCITDSSGGGTGLPYGKISDAVRFGDPNHNHTHDNEWLKSLMATHPDRSRCNGRQA